jgi:hypothetical protein
MSTRAPAQASSQANAPQPAEQLLQLATGYMVSSALYGVTSLGIPDLLKSGSKSVAELSVLSGSHEGALYRILRALSSIGVFAENPSRTFLSLPSPSRFARTPPIQCAT